MSSNPKLTKRENIIQAVKFLLFSCSAGAIQAGSFALLSELAKFPYWPAYLIALTLSVVWNFTLNRNYTFKAANNVPVAMMKVLGYYAVFTPLSTWLGDVCVNAGAPKYLVLFITMVINLITEFLFDRFVVFRGSINTKESKKPKNG